MLQSSNVVRWGVHAECEFQVARPGKAGPRVNCKPEIGLRGAFFFGSFLLGKQKK
jgi:hypothetical protein